MTTTDQPTIPPDYEPLPLADAARRLGISPNAVLQRRKRGTVHARETAPRQWVYYVPPVGSADRQPTGRRSASTSREPTGDRNALAPILADLIRQNGELHAANAVLSERNRILSDRLAAYESGASAIPMPAASPSVAAWREYSHADERETPATMPDATTAPGARPGPSTRVRRAWLALRGRG